MHSTAIIDALVRALPGDPSRFQPVEALDGMPTLLVAPEQLVETCRALKDLPELRFALLADITAVDFHPRDPRYELVYILASLGVGGFGDTPKRLRLKVRLQGDDPVVGTVSGVWAAANWAEREIYDFFGIRFDGHPDLRRILMPDEWEGFPLRKDYPVQIKDPVKTYEPLQVSEEQFVATVQASRSQARQE